MLLACGSSGPGQPPSPSHLLHSPSTARVRTVRHAAAVRGRAWNTARDRRSMGGLQALGPAAVGPMGGVGGAADQKAGPPRQVPALSTRPYSTRNPRKIAQCYCLAKPCNPRLGQEHTGQAVIGAVSLGMVGWAWGGWDASPWARRLPCGGSDEILLETGTEWAACMDDTLAETVLQQCVEEFGVKGEHQTPFPVVCCGGQATPATGPLVASSSSHAA